jgi:hypothetical protein
MGFLAIFLAAAPLLTSGDAQPTAAEACPVTLAAHRPSFAEPSPSSASRFWYGDESLAVLLSSGGTWRGMGPERHYRNKLFWWRKGFDGRTESQPALSVTGRRLDGDAPPASISPATNAHHADFGGWAMLTSVEFPTGGCWELTGEYRGAESRFVVLVLP